MYARASGPRRRCIATDAACAPTAPITVSLRAGPASLTGVPIATAAPALAAALAANTNGSSCRAACQAGTAVFAISTAVYVAIGRPLRPAPTLADAPARGITPSTRVAVAIPFAAPDTATT